MSQSFGGIFRDNTLKATKVVKSLSELWKALCDALQHGEKVTVQGGESSFHTQALTRFGRYLNIADETQDIEVHLTPTPIVVAPSWATWVDILRVVRPFDLIPKITVTTEEATPGGTASANSITQASRLFGHEIDSIAWIEIVLPPQSPNDPAPAAPKKIDRPLPGDNSADAQLFRAVVGGYGTVAVIWRVAYDLLPLSRHAKVLTSVSEPSLADGLKALDPANGGPDSRRVVTLLQTWNGHWRHYLYDTTLAEYDTVHDPENRKSFVAYEGPSPARMLAEWLLITFGGAATGTFGASVVFDKYVQDQQRFVNDIDGYFFLMQPTRNLKRDDEVQRDYDGGPIIQETYVLPNAAAAEAFVADAKQLLESDYPKGLLTLFAHLFSGPTPQNVPVVLRTVLGPPEARRRMAEHEVERRRLADDKGIPVEPLPAYDPSSPKSVDRWAISWFDVAFLTGRFVPALFDIIYLKQDDSLLSATTASAGYAVTIAFQDPALFLGSSWRDYAPRKKLADACYALMRKLARICTTTHGGRVHLTKTVLVPLDASGKAQPYMETIMKPQLDALDALRLANGATEPRLSSWFAEEHLRR